MRPWRWSGVFDGLFEEPDGCGAKEGQDGGPAEDVDIGHERGLLLHQAVEQAHGAGAALGAPELVAEIAGDGGRAAVAGRSSTAPRLAPISVWCSAARRMRAVVAMAMPMDPPMLRSMLKRPVALPISSRGIVEVRHGGEGHKDKAQGKPGEHDGNKQREGADVEVDHAEDERADAKADEAGAEQLAVVDAGAEDADDRRADERPDAARTDDQAGREGGVAQNLLIDRAAGWRW